MFRDQNTQLQKPHLLGGISCVIVINCGFLYNYD